MRLRLRAETRITGPELDVETTTSCSGFGCVGPSRQATYYCRHDQFAASPVRKNLPIDPYWLIEAFGIAELDPALPHQGPFRLPGGQLEIRTIRGRPKGRPPK